jgi:RNA 3'-terminal phosphate cyclase (ATP)
VGTARGVTAVVLDGAHGEGGGQIVRSALALSLVTGRPFRIERIRANRAKPGLAPQHRAAVEAAAAVGGAAVTGAAVGSRALEFAPGRTRAGDYELAIGTAGSATLVLQTVLPPLLLAGAPSTVTVTGGTHNPMAPPWEFVADTYLPALRALGARVDASLDRYGFYPRGGGRIRARIAPAPLRRFARDRPVAPAPADARALVVRLPVTIGQRELAVVAARLGWPAARRRVVASDNSDGPGNALLLGIAAGDGVETVSAIGARGARGEDVAARAAGEAERFVALGVPVGEHLQDQLLVPLAVGAGGSFLTGPPTLHTTTNADVIRAFLPDVRIDLVPGDAGRTRVLVEPDGGGPPPGSAESS